MRVLMVRNDDRAILALCVVNDDQQFGPEVARLKRQAEARGYGFAVLAPDSLDEAIGYVEADTDDEPEQPARVTVDGKHEQPEHDAADHDWRAGHEPART